MPSAMPVDAAAPQRIVSYDPATLEALGAVAATAPAELPAMLAKARQAQVLWARVGVADRARCLRRVRDAIIDDIDALATLISRENGKPRTEALASELFPTVYLLDYFCGQAPRVLADAPIDLRFWRFVRRSSVLQRRPRGVVGIMSPWNFPFAIPGGEIAMALLAGNAVLFKPARATCLTGAALARVFAHANLPAGLLQVVQGAGQAITQLPLDFLAFTGSVSTGKQVMAHAAQNLVPVMLELGGKDPMVVCADANLEVASSTAVWGAFVNAGQACASVERLYVDARVADDFVARVVEKTRRLRQGRDILPDVDVGAMCTAEQREAVMAQVEQARQAGASILCGGGINDDLAPGYFYRPTVLRDLAHSSPCLHEETFGPTLPIVSFADEAEAVTLANASRFGLTASVWTRNIARGRALAEQLVAGSVLINDAAFTHGLAETPWGGPKESGIGRTHGREGLLEFTETRHIHTNRLSSLKNPWLYPYSASAYALFRSAAMLLRSGWRSKWRGLRGCLRTLPQILRSRS